MKNAIGIFIPHGATGELRTLCPQCGPDRPRPSKSLSVNLNQGIFYCHYCGWKGRLGRPGMVPSLPRPGPRQRSPDEIQRRREELRRVWREARPITPGDPAGRYLQRRGLWQEPPPSVLRCHPRLEYWYGDGRPPTLHPALIAAMQDPQDTVVTLHRVYLTNAGEKASVDAPKKSMQTPTTYRRPHRWPSVCRDRAQRNTTRDLRSRWHGQRSSHERGETLARACHCMRRAAPACRDTPYTDTRDGRSLMVLTSRTLGCPLLLSVRAMVMLYPTSGGEHSYTGSTPGNNRMTTTAWAA
jgi:hypothetical protein